MPHPHVPSVYPLGSCSCPHGHRQVLPRVLADLKLKPGGEGRLQGKEIPQEITMSGLLQVSGRAIFRCSLTPPVPWGVVRTGASLAGRFFVLVFMLQTELSVGCSSLCHQTSNWAE